MKLEDKIRESYKGILNEEQIEETIKWWKELIEQERRDAEYGIKRVKLKTDKNHPAIVAYSEAV